MTLSACSVSRSDAPRSAPPADPVIQTRTIEVRVCPPELRAARAPRPAPGAGAELSGNATGMAWLNDLLTYLGLVEDRLADAAEGCPA